MEEEKKQTKVLFRYYSDVLEEIVVETMWADIIDEKNGIYKLDNIPFYGPMIASDDEFYAEFDEQEQMLTYSKTTKHSGNSIVIIVIEKGYDKETLRNEFKKLGCESEGVNEKYFSLEIKKDINYSIIKPILNQYEADEIIGYAEPCLG